MGDSARGRGGLTVTGPGRGLSAPQEDHGSLTNSLGTCAVWAGHWFFSVAVSAGVQAQPLGPGACISTRGWALTPGSQDHSL